MKVKLLLPLLLLAMSLAGCNGAGKGGKSESGKSEGDQSEETTETSEKSETTESSESELNPYADFEEKSGESEAFPMEEVNAFLDYFKMDVELPTPDGASWTYDQSVYNGVANFYAYCQDDGEPGVDAIEDSYKAALEGAGFVVDDSDYENTGYVVLSEVYEDFELIFYSYDGDFCFDLYGPFAGLTTQGFPVDALIEFAAAMDVVVTAEDLLIPQINAIWGSYTYAGLFGISYVAITEATEDDVKAYAAMAEEAGWTVDDLHEEYPEYYEFATYDIYKPFNDEVELDFFASYEDGLFTVEFAIYDYSEVE